MLEERDERWSPGIIAEEDVGALLQIRPWGRDFVIACNAIFLKRSIVDRNCSSHNPEISLEYDPKNCNNI
jgi:hypothetical protein